MLRRPLTMWVRKKCSCLVVSVPTSAHPNDQSLFATPAGVYRELYEELTRRVVGNQEWGKQEGLPYGDRSLVTTVIVSLLGGLPTQKTSELPASCCKLCAGVKAAATRDGIDAQKFLGTKPDLKYGMSHANVPSALVQEFPPTFMNKWPFWKRGVGANFLQSTYLPTHNQRIMHWFRTTLLLMSISSVLAAGAPSHAPKLPKGVSIGNAFFD